MKSLLVLLIVISIGWIGGGSYYWACVVKGHCDNMPSQENVADRPSANDNATDPADDSSASADASGSTEGMNLPAFRVNYQDQEAMRLNGSFPFKHSGISGELSTEMSSSLDRLAAYMKQFPERTLRITGLFEANEPTLGEFANMGLARADFVVKQLQNRGIDPSRILRLPKQVEIGQLFGDVKLPSIEFDLLDKLKQAEGTSTGNGAIPDALAKPLNLYFSFNRFDLVLTDAERNQISQMIQFLKENPSRRLSVTGHTDMTGDRDSNQFLGNQRADQAKDYFIQFGVSPDQIDTDSKGQDDPIGDNATEEGRRKNRRAEIKIQ